MRDIKVRIERLPEGQGLPLPAYQTDGSSGMDVCAAVAEEVVIAPGEIERIPAGFRIAVPPGHEAQMRPRSGLALKSGIAVLNSPGTIDSDYRGPVGIILANLGSEPFTVRRGDRIAQMVICPVARAEIEEVERVDATARGRGGFGHTGV